MADEDRGEVVQDSPLRVAKEKFGTISTHLHSFCRYCAMQLICKIRV